MMGAREAERTFELPREVRRLMSDEKTSRTSGEQKGALNGPVVPLRKPKHEKAYEKRGEHTLNEVRACSLEGGW